MHAILFPLRHVGLPCDTFGCRSTMERPNTGTAKWNVGRPDGPMSVTHHLCDDCASHMIAHAPAELVSGGNDLKDQITAELEAKFQEQLESIKADHETQLKLLAAAQPQVVTVVESPEEKPPEPSLDEAAVGAIYRCLECDREFSAKVALANHMRTHKQG